MFKKRAIIIPILISIAMILSGSVAFADADAGSSAYVRAEQLNLLGLLKGVGRGDYDMLREPTRAESVVMVLRLLGKEKEALQQPASHPFSDVPEWATRHIAYAYGNGLVKGVSARQFDAGSPVNSEQYITFLLRALRYSDGDDFAYGDSKILASKIGLLKGWIDKGAFLRSDMILLSYNAMCASLKDENVTLAEHLIKTEVCTDAQWRAALSLDSDAGILGPGYEWKSTVSITLASPDEFFNSLKNALETLPDEVLIYVPPWKEEEYLNHISAIYAHLMGYSNGYRVVDYPGSGKISMIPTYSESFKSLAYLQNPTIPVSDETKALAMRGLDIYMDKFSHENSEYGLVKSIHDYIADYLVYDMSGMPGTMDFDGALNTGTATCGGYSAMFQFFAGISGLECKTVFGFGVNAAGKSANHAWNMVKVDGNWYNIDVTWDDPVTNTGENIIKYDYFLISDDELSKGHTWDRKYYPEAPYSWN
ncbi:MAG: hypothetical protein FWG42_08055 [Clostridiales bacterium]|nr:hypothetical protein [Clostridiales bacterium]